MGESSALLYCWVFVFGKLVLRKLKRKNLHRCILCLLGDTIRAVVRGCGMAYVCLCSAKWDFFCSLNKSIMMIKEGNKRISDDDDHDLWEIK